MSHQEARRTNDLRPQYPEIAVDNHRVPKATQNIQTTLEKLTAQRLTQINRSDNPHQLTRPREPTHTWDETTLSNRINQHNLTGNGDKLTQTDLAYRHTNGRDANETTCHAKGRQPNQSCT
ncbi:hypothetical protein T265_12350 [Opisthorchis viverrini]|uniref:Uncharacterized protein n=1 Tax=Opisthorchis viverrini TaxID=6198 RepID=A0A074ZSE2_OPIVI|nr:hypothetical protein T265_12350 [Opisthorchis viverrini]KER18179.1 hypothetical protein T265_12350 [Opisthorchis viverrini]